MNFKFDVQAMLATLPMMLKGMVCIFIVAGAIILTISLLRIASEKLGKKKQ